MQLNQHFTEELLVPGETVALSLTLIEPEGEELTAEQAEKFWGFPQHMLRGLANALKQMCYEVGTPDVQTFSHEASYRTPTATVTYRLDVTAGLDPEEILCGLGPALHPLHHSARALEMIRQPQNINPFAGTPLEALINALRDGGAGIDVQVIDAGDLVASIADSAEPSTGFYL